MVELLIAMFIGLFIMAGVLTVMVDSKESFLSEQELALIQENVRFLHDEMSYDIRMAGYSGCNKTGTMANTIVGASDPDNWMLSAPGIIGYEAGDADIPDEFAADVLNDAAAGEVSDVVIVTRAQETDLRVDDHEPSSAVVEFVGNDTRPENGRIMMLSSSDCRHSAIFQVDGSSSSNPNKIGHSKGGSISPGNCSKALSSSSGGGYECGGPDEPSPSFTGMTFTPGSSVLEYIAHAYYLAESPVTELPSLYREELVAAGNAAATQAQELVSGVERMEILYGVDTTPTASDGTVDRYFEADDITVKEATGVSGWVGWDRVTTVRLDLVLRSARPVFAENTAVDLGDGYTFNDRFMRQRVNSTIRIRNRGLGG